MLGQRIQLREGVGTPAEAAAGTWQYNDNGQVTQVIDANGNRAELRYDDHARQNCWLFPSPLGPPSYNDTDQETALATAGSAPGDCVYSGDFEAYQYDLNSNRTVLRRRDTRRINYAYEPIRAQFSTIPEHWRSSLEAEQTDEIVLWGTRSRSLFRVTSITKLIGPYWLVRGYAAPA